MPESMLLPRRRVRVVGDPALGDDGLWRCLVESVDGPLGVRLGVQIVEGPRMTEMDRVAFADLVGLSGKLSDGGPHG